MLFYCIFVDNSVRTQRILGVGLVYLDAQVSDISNVSLPMSHLALHVLRAVDTSAVSGSFPDWCCRNFFCTDQHHGSLHVGMKHRHCTPRYDTTLQPGSQSWAHP